MSDLAARNPLGLGGAPRSGQVERSFSHRRTHAVVVETKRRSACSVPSPASRACPGRSGGGAPSSPNLGDPSKRPARNLGSRDAAPSRCLRFGRGARAGRGRQRAADERRARRSPAPPREIEAKEREDRQREAACAPRPRKRNASAARPRPRPSQKAAAREADILGTQRRQPASRIGLRPPRLPLPAIGDVYVHLLVPLRMTRIMLMCHWFFIASKV